MWKLESNTYFKYKRQDGSQ